MSKSTPPLPPPEILQGRRESAQQTAQALKARLNVWKNEETVAKSFRDKIGVSLFWAINARWFARIEEVIASLEQGAVTIRQQEEESRRQQKSGFLSLFR